TASRSRPGPERYTYKVTSTMRSSNSENCRRNVRLGRKFVWSFGLQRESTEEAVCGDAIDIDGKEVSDFFLSALKIHDAIAVGATAQLSVSFFRRRFHEYFLYG